MRGGRSGARGDGDERRISWTGPIDPGAVPKNLPPHGLRPSGGTGAVSHGGALEAMAVGLPVVRHDYRAGAGDRRLQQRWSLTVPPCPLAAAVMTACLILSATGAGPGTPRAVRLHDGRDR